MKLIIEKSKDGEFWGTVTKNGSIITEHAETEQKLLTKMKQQIGVEFKMRLKHIEFEIKRKY